MNIILTKIRRHILLKTKSNKINRNGQKCVAYVIFIEKCTHCLSFTGTLNVWNTQVVQHFTALLHHK